MIIKYEFDCSVCGKHVIKSRAEWQTPPVFCSNECKYKGQIGKERKKIINVDFVCLHCGKHVTGYRGPQYLAKYGQPRFCGRRCLGASQRGANNPNYKDGVRKMKGGYIGVHIPDHPAATSDGTVPEHRLVMEKHLGRYLTDEEIVHHDDEDRSNNKIENLVLCANQSEHSKLHRRGGRYYEKNH